ncbi:hypothetical protein DEHRE_12280 [Dehalobacter restrictus DSM 9455]|uniref:Uncharacterized protein n=1 Tax=Dehalobacter restrictus (strain DSM 9455 / PER-K23) TaxID=871738 RepID=A0ABN4BWI4_DEHRP|nr:hypothetical protein DEHRE_12280 [Dehalobacter restrictus DSM 9455]
MKGGRIANSLPKGEGTRPLGIPAVKDTAFLRLINKWL